MRPLTFAVKKSDVLCNVHLEGEEALHFDCAHEDKGDWHTTKSSWQNIEAFD